MSCREPIEVTPWSAAARRWVGVDMAVRNAGVFPAASPSRLWVVRVGGDDGELRPWHYIYICSIESRLITQRGRTLESSGMAPGIPEPRYRGTSPIRNHRFLAPYSRPMPRALRWS